MPDYKSRATRSGAIKSIAHPSIADTKAAVNFKELVEETHLIGRDGKVCCPCHDDHNPSCHIYENGFRCYACGAHGDAIAWLEAVNGYGKAEAITELRRRAGGGVIRRSQRRFKPPDKVAPQAFPTVTTGCKSRPVPTDVLASYMRRVAKLDRLPTALQGRGFNLEDAKSLHMAADREGLLFAVPGPDGVVLAIKRRRAHPYKDQRYGYELPGHGAPAWCSPKMLEHNPVLVVEGELNGMAAWLARPDLAVMGAAGAGGGLHTEALRDKSVYIYADGDKAGDGARGRWAKAAHKAGAAQVYLLTPWEADACDLAGMCRTALTSALETGLETAQTYSPPVDKSKPVTRRPRSLASRRIARWREGVSWS